MNKHDLNDEILDDVLRYIAGEEMENMGEKLPTDEELEKIELRPEFETRMNQFFRRSRRRKAFHGFMIKAGIAAAIVMVVSTITVINVDALRSHVFDYFTEVGAKKTTLHVEAIDYSLYDDQLHYVCLPKYIPEGYSLASVQNANGRYLLTFNNDNGARILYSNLQEGSSFIDSEMAAVEQLTVNNEPAMYYIKDNYTTFVFNFNGNTYIIRCTPSNPQLSKNDLIRIAESLE